VIKMASFFISFSSRAPIMFLVLGRQRQMQSNNVALAQQGFEIGQTSLRKDVVGQNFLTKGLGDPRDRLADRAIADDTQRRTAHVADRMVEETELVTLLPAPGAHIVAVSQDIPAKREGQREDMFRNRIEGIIADVRDGDAMRFAIGFVHNIGAGGRDRDQFKIGSRASVASRIGTLLIIAIVAFSRRSDESRPPRSPHIPYSYAENSVFADWPQESNVEKDDRMLHGVIFP